MLKMTPSWYVAVVIYNHYSWYCPNVRDSIYRHSVVGLLIHIPARVRKYGATCAVIFT